MLHGMGSNNDIPELQAVGQTPSRADAENNLGVGAAIDKTDIEQVQNEKKPFTLRCIPRRMIPHD